MDLAIDEDVNVPLGKTLIPTYLCPSANHVYGLEKAPHSLPLADPTMQFAVIDYNGMNGTEQLFAGGDRPCWTTAALPNASNCRLASFTDGTAQTIDVVETVKFGRGLWIHGRPHYNQAACAINSLDGFNDPNSLFPDGSNLPVSNRGPGKGIAGTWGISSSHPGGANTLFVDGSVHFLGNSVSAETLAALITRDGGEPIDGRRFDGKLPEAGRPTISNEGQSCQQNLPEQTLCATAAPARRSGMLAIASALAVGSPPVGQPPVGTVALPVPDNTANAFQTSLRYDASGEPLRLGRADGLGANRRHGQLPEHRLGDGREPSRCGTDQLLPRWTNPAAEQRRRRHF